MKPGKPEGGNVKLRLEVLLTIAAIMTISGLLYLVTVQNATLVSQRDLIRRMTKEPACMVDTAAVKQFKFKKHIIVSEN